MLPFRAKVYEPRPTNTEEFLNAFQNVNERFKREGKLGSIMMRVDVDETGRVTRVKPIHPSRLVTLMKGAVLLMDGRTGKRLADPPSLSRDVQLRLAAAELARLIRYKPATRGGRPVRFKGLRINIALGE